MIDFLLLHNWNCKQIKKNCLAHAPPSCQVHDTLIIACSHKWYSDTIAPIKMSL